MAANDVGLDGLEVTVGRPVERSMPLISCGAPDGFAHGVQAIRDNVPERAQEILRICGRMKHHWDGALVLFVQPPVSVRRLVLVQDSRGPYYRRHDSGHSGWKDFYYATAWAAFDGSEHRWRASEVELEHPSHSPWPRNVLPAVLEALGHLRHERLLSLRRLHVVPCGDAVDQAVIDETRARLSAEGTSHRPLTVEPYPLERMGLRQMEGVELRRVLVPAARGDRPTGAGRPPERIPVVLERLGEAWSRHPDMRLGQLLLNLTNTGPSPLFDVEDVALAARIEDFLETGRWGHETGRPDGATRRRDGRPGSVRPPRRPAAGDES